MTVAEKINSIKEKRTQALSQKINLLKARDGSDHPEIKSLKEEDEFNLQQLFGLSKSANIDWLNMGVEGLIQCYYKIISIIDGTKRDNVITNNDETLNEDYNSKGDSDLTLCAINALNGVSYKSGFFIGDENSNNDIKIRASRGEYDDNSSSFGNNIKNSSKMNSYLIKIIEDCITIIGDKSPLGPHAPQQYSVTVPEFKDFNDSILGKRFLDKLSYSQVNPIIGTEGAKSIPGSVTYGDGNYDSKDENPNRNFYDSNLDTKISSIKSFIEQLKKFINYTKISSDKHFLNNKIIPGKDGGYILQDGWISTIDSFSVSITTFADTISKKTVNSVATTNDNILDVDKLIIDFKTSLNNFNTKIKEILKAINALFNDTSGGISLYEFRKLWIKNIIDIKNSGSKMTLLSIDTAITNAKDKIIDSENSFGLIGVIKENNIFEEGIKTPSIAGIETYLSIDTREKIDDQDNPTYLQMIPSGFIVAWEEVFHATQYILQKSLDKNTWTSVSITDIDENTGKVLSYYIDKDVSPDKNYFYRVKCLDSGVYNNGDYNRFGATSGFSVEKSSEDFQNTPSKGTNSIASSVIKKPKSYTEDYSGLFKHSTLKKGKDSENNPTNTIFKSDVEFDSKYSNIEVFINGLITSSYTEVDSKKIELNTSVEDEDQIVIIVYFGYDVKQKFFSTFSELPTTNNKNGDIYFIYGEKCFYYWSDVKWEKLILSTPLNHTNLVDMPDSGGLNADHDERYVLQGSLNSEIEKIQKQVSELSYLIPSSANKLSGDMKYIDNFLTRKISGGGFNNLNVLNAYQEYDKIVVGTSFSFKLVDDSMFSDADKGEISFYVNDSLKDTINLGNKFIVSEQRNKQSWTPFSNPQGIIQIESIYPYKNFEKHQKCDVKFVVDKSFLIPGENTIRFEHKIENETRRTQNHLFFWDSDTVKPSIKNLQIKEKLLQSNKFISGLRYYDLNDTLNVNIEILNLFNNTYIDDKFSIKMNGLGVNDFKVSDEKDYDYNQTYIYNDDIKLNKNNVSSDTCQSILTIDGVQRTKTQNNILVNTYLPASNDNYEYFLDEDYRLNFSEYDKIPSTIKKSWNSENKIGDNDLLVYNGFLCYPDKDFSFNYMPKQQHNYSNLSGDRYYIRAFHDSTVHNEGIFEFKGDNIDNNTLKMFLKLPGQTGWMSLKDPFDLNSFKGLDNDGCLLNQTDYKFKWTSSNFNTAKSNNMIILKIMMEDNNTKINEIHVLW